MPVGHLIRDRRESLGLSLDDLAERLRPDWPKIDKGTLSRIENDKRRIFIDQLELIAKALGCTARELME